MGTVLTMNEVEVGHRWEPITDLTDSDLATASEELPALARMWQNVRGELDPGQVHDFNERLKREWAIETGIIERLYILDRGTAQLLIEQGIDASLIASDATAASSAVPSEHRHLPAAVRWTLRLAAMRSA